METPFGALPVGGFADAAAMEQDAAESEQRKVVVLGVPWQTEDATLEAHFGRFGGVEEAVIMRERYTGKSRGFGFVTFCATADALRAVGTEHLIDGRRCEAKFALPEGKVGSARTTRIFVARIPFSVSDIAFRAYFEQFGTVQDAYMPKDPSKQGHRGIGFVTYASAESVERVMANTHVLNGNEIAIDRATPKDKAALLPGRLSSSQPNLALLHGSSAHGGQQYAGLLQAAAVAGAQAHAHAQQAASPQRYGARQDMLGLGDRRMSHPAMPSASQLGSPPRGGAPQDTPGGLGSGGYASPAGLDLLARAQAAHALRQQLSTGSLSSLDGTSPSQLISLLSANAVAAAAAGGYGGGAQQQHHHQGTPSSAEHLAGLLGGHSEQYGTAGSWLHGIQAARAAPGAPAAARAGPRVFVGKLNKDTSEQDVKDYFTRFGYVMDVYLPRDKNNKREHRGFGFVTFETEASIQRVVAHGPHQIRGSIVAIDAAVPRQEEMLAGPPMDAGPLGQGARLAPHPEREPEGVAMHGVRHHLLNQQQGAF